MMKKVVLILYVAVFGILFSGCGTTVSLSEYIPAPLERSKYIPSKEDIKNNILPKIIIMDIDENSFFVANAANLGKSLSTNINQGLSRAKSVNILKRVSDNTLDQEIKAAELAREIGSDVGQADYIITGELSDVSYDYKFNEGYYYVVDTKEGKVKKYSPPYINYNSCVSGNLKVLTLPRLDEVKSIQFNGCSSNSHEARTPRDAKISDNSLVRRAGANALNSAIYPLKNFFAKKGYIYEMRKDGDDMIVKTNLGIQNGAKEGENVIIYAIEENYNLLEDRTKKAEIQIGEGTISNQITDEYSWVIVDELDEDRVIKAGDFIKIRYSKSYFSDFGSYL